MNSLTMQEPSYENDEYLKSDGGENVGTIEETDVRKSVSKPRINIVGETREHWLTRNLLNNYLMHCTG